MLSSLLWKFRVFSRRLWIRALLIAALAIVAAGIAPLVSPELPGWFSNGITQEDVRGLLDILTNSMLAVTTFSMSIMVTAHLSADKGVTPRTHRMLQEDTRTQTVLATFVGSFIYALTQILLINAGVVTPEHYPVMYLFTIGVIAIVVVALLRWIAHLSGLGSVEETTRRVEERAREAMDLRIGSPHLGGKPLLDPERDIPEGVHAIHATGYGFVQHVDTGALSEAVEEWDARFYLARLPGDWVSAGDPVGYCDAAEFDDQREEHLRECLTIGDVRGSEQDLGHTFIVMAEIAERALSPGINDPRTATDVITRLVRLSADLAHESTVDDVELPRVYVPPLNISRLLEAAFDVIARDGRNFVEVQTHIQRAYRTLSTHRNREVREAVRILSRRALAYAEDGLLLAEDLARVRAVAISNTAAPLSPANRPTPPRESRDEALREDQDSEDRGEKR